MSYEDRYGDDVLAGFSRRGTPTPKRQIELKRGLALEHMLSEFYGEVVGVREGGFIEVKDFDGLIRAFPLRDAFMIDGEQVELISPRTTNGRKVTASGSYAVAPQRAQVAKASRIFVEGRHDAELIEKVWGDDLRHEGIVVELLEGVDHLDQVLCEFQPSVDRRAGVLVDHLVVGSKESRITAEVTRPYPGSVLVLGHPFVDVWQAVKPTRVGLSMWPSIPRTVEWKRGICEHLGWPFEEQADIADAWQRILARVRDYRDLEPALSGQVEHLIDFVTVGHH